MAGGRGSSLRTGGSRSGRCAGPAWLDAVQMGPLDDKLGIRITDFDPDHVVGIMPVEARGGTLQGAAGPGVVGGRT